jgi:hypothetical protein
MHVGLVMECDYREGVTQEEAFDEVFAQMDVAETGGLGAADPRERDRRADAPRAQALRAR